MSRFYPEFVPPFPHEPSPSNFAIRPIANNVGEGVVALKGFETGQIVFRFTGFYMSEQTLFTLQVEPGLFVHDPFFMGKVLHRCDPNCAVDMKTRQFTARRPIMAGEWITMNYETTEDQLFRSFECVCGAIPCDGLEPSRLIQGKKAGRSTGRSGSRSNGLSVSEQAD